MRKRLFVLGLLIVILLLLRFGCNGCKNALSDLTSDSSIESDTSCVDYNPSPTMVVIGDDTVNIMQKNPISDNKTLDGRHGRAVGSLVKTECCDPSPIKDVVQCCCDEVEKKYNSIVLKNDIDSAVDFKAKDEFYRRCQEKFGKDFEKKIEAIEIKAWGE